MRYCSGESPAVAAGLFLYVVTVFAPITLPLRVCRENVILCLHNRIRIRCRTTVACVGVVSIALGREPVVNFPPSLILGQAVALLDLAFEQLTATLDGH